MEERNTAAGPTEDPAPTGGRRAEDMASGGVQYHIRLGPGDVGDFLLLCGDPVRASRTASRLDAVDLERRHREYVTITGMLGPSRVTVMATGIGPDNTEIALAEVHATGARPTIIRVGSCGGIGPGVRAGDLVVTQASVRLENTSSAYAPDSFPAVSDPAVMSALDRAASHSPRRHHLGITATAPGFYAPQGRPALGKDFRNFPTPEELAGLGVLNYEMESSLLFVMASAAGLRAGCICAVFADRTGGGALSDGEMAGAESDCIDAALEAVRSLAGGQG